ncbi:MAG: hypothetical protein C5B58_15175 [Acidobacteria bacterium]|nr:MAG: hypothetical protein C5B58_15175 [Acidobacteriota bacterium]
MTDSRQKMVSRNPIGARPKWFNQVMIAFFAQIPFDWEMPVGGARPQSHRGFLMQSLLLRYLADTNAPACSPFPKPIVTPKLILHLEAIGASR